MNLGKIKELEDLKKDFQKYSSEYNNLSNKRRRNYIVAVYKDFIDFFKAQGFTISDGSKEIEAVYGSTKIKIDKYNEDEWYMGCYAVWHIECMTNKSKYRILLNKLGKYPTVNVTYGSSKILSEDEKLDKEIEQIKESIAKTKKDIEEFDSVKLGYGLINEDDKSLNDKYPQFETMKELLESIFK